MAIEPVSFTLYGADFDRFSQALGASFERYGFAECPAFGDYVSDEFSLCMDRRL